MKSYAVILSMMMLNISSCRMNEQPGLPEEGDFSNILTQQEKDNARMTPELLWKFGRVSDIAVSPGGNTILYLVTRYDPATDGKHTWIYTIPATGGDPRNLTENFQSCSNPRWLDESTIVFLARDGNTNRIWKMNAEGGDREAISDLKGDISGFEFAPGTGRLFYLQDVKIDPSTSDIYPDLPLAKGMIINDMMYRHWDSWHDYTYNHIFITDLAGGRIREGTDILAGEPFDAALPPFFDISDIAWSRDGLYLAFASKRLRGKEFAESTDADIFMYDSQKKTIRNLTEGMAGYDRYPVFAPDSRKLAFQSMETPGYEADKRRLFVIDIETGTKTYITEGFDQDASNFAWHSEGKKIYFISGIHATYQVYEAEIETGNIRAITKGVHDYISLSYASGTMAGLKSTLSVAPEIFRIDLQNGLESQLTFTNKNIYDVIKLGKVEERWIKTTDGKNMLVWIVFPPDFDSLQKYPALLYCQGGPQSAISQRFSYRWNLQLMASGGYIVVAPNRRGLPTFGHEWNAQISGDYGGQNIKDYLSAIDEVKKEPYVDADRLGAVGASYGGYSVLYLAGCHEKRFRVFIAHCGIFNLESQSAGTEEMFFVNHDLGGYYWDKPKPVSFTRYSPHLYVDKWDTPIMLVTGAKDYRIPYTESLQAFNVAQLRGIPSKLLFFPDENHWVTKPQNSILWQREFFGWLDRWLK